MARRSRNTDETIEVKVARLGGEVKTVALPKDSTVSDALEAAGIDPENYNRLRVAGVIVEPEDIVDNGDIVTVSGGMKGGNA